MHRRSQFWCRYIIPVDDWLREMVASGLISQTYPHWQLVLANDGSSDSRIRPQLDEFARGDPRITVVHSDRNRGVSAASNNALAHATGSYVCFLDHDDALEPHALHRLGRLAIITECCPDLIYSDEVITGSDLDDARLVRVRPAFSYDYYLNTPYFVHLIAVRTELVRAIGGWDETMSVSQDVDLVLRLLTVCQRITHIPDVLYRWRTHPNSLGNESQSIVSAATTGAIRRHLSQIGIPAEVQASSAIFNLYDVRFSVLPTAKVCILIPTKNQRAFLRDCVESLQRTVPPGLADIVVIDHSSDDPETLQYLNELRARSRVVLATGPFNFSAIMNFGVSKARDQAYTHYLFLNNDVKAKESGWLERLLEFGCRTDVGCVGATLLYPDATVQHAGVIIGPGSIGPADHAYRTVPFNQVPWVRTEGDNCGLVCNRDYSAVTAACLLIRTQVFDLVGGFDEQLAVGYNDTDLCLRVRAAGYKVIQAANAVLIHYESQTRGVVDDHPSDTQLFIQRYSTVLETGDPYSNPLLEVGNMLMNVLSPMTAATEEVMARTTPVVPPRYGT